MYAIGTSSYDSFSSSSTVWDRTTCEGSHTDFIGSIHGGLITTLVARQVDRPCFNPLENFIWPNEPQINLPFLPNLITSFIGEIIKKHVVANHELDLSVPLVQIGLFATLSCSKTLLIMSNFLQGFLYKIWAKKFGFPRFKLSNGRSILTPI